MAKSYENLMGSVGRSVFYRPERQRIRELLSRDAKPKLLVGGKEYPLFDISMNGVSFFSADHVTAWPIGQEISMSLLLHTEEVYSGRAKIARAEAGPRGCRVALGLSSGFLDLPEMRRKDDEKRLAAELLEGPEKIQALVPASYREVISKMVHFHSYYRRSLREHEGRYLREGKGENARLELMQRSYEAIQPRWWELEVEASRSGLECFTDRDTMLAAKRYTEDLVTPLVMEAALGRRAYTKPLGYAGDFQVMLYMYEQDFEGESIYGKVIHKCYASSHPMCAGVRTRNDLVVQWMEEEHKRILSNAGDSAHFRVVGLGCGPAREVSSFVAKNRTWPGSIVWTLIDQEEEALSVAYKESKAEIAKWGSAGQLNLLNLSFVQMLSEGLPLNTPGSHDYIYSAGLFDYLRESRAQGLVRGLYDLLAPGGRMAIGNLVAPNEFYWGAEFLMDWTLLYRTKEEMFQLADLLPESAEKEVVAEPSGAYYFLLVRKH